MLPVDQRVATPSLQGKAELIGTFLIWGKKTTHNGIKHYV